MILDHIENAALYYPLNARIAAALQALQTTALLRAVPGRYELQGTDIFALPQRYDTKARSKGKWEAHRKYIDIQYIVTGAEEMGHANLADMTITEPYNEEKDILFLTGPGNFFAIQAGQFAIFYPHDVHMPTLAVNNAPTHVHKIVIKVRADLA